MEQNWKVLDDGTIDIWNWASPEQILNVSFEGKTAEECFQIHREIGIFLGYPPCCIEQFIQEEREGKYPAMERGCHSLVNGDERRIYIPCDNCVSLGIPCYPARSRT